MFDIDVLRSTITETLTALYDENYPQVKESVEKYLASLEERLTSVAEAETTGNIDTDFFAARLKDELVLLESELIALKVIGLNIVQDAINKAISDALKIITG